jgi:hypothetical protein
MRVPVSEGMEGDKLPQLHDEFTQPELEIDSVERRRRFTLSPYGGSRSGAMKHTGFSESSGHWVPASSAGVV